MKSKGLNSVVVKTAQVWRESKIAREMLRRCGPKVRLRAKCCEGRMCRTGGCGRLRAMLARARNGRSVNSEAADRTAMCGTLLGNAIADS